MEKSPCLVSSLSSAFNRNHLDSTQERGRKREQRQTSEPQPHIVPPLAPLAFPPLTTRHAHGDGGTVCRELGMPVQPLGQACTAERPKPSNQEMDGCGHHSAPISIPVLPHPAPTTALQAQGNGHLAPGSGEQTESVPHPSGQITERAAAHGTCPRPRQEESPALIVPGRTMPRPRRLPGTHRGDQT